MKKNYFLTASIAMLATVSAVAQPTVPPNPAAGNASNCTVVSSNNTPLDQCPAGSTTFVTNFQGGTYNRGNNGNNLGAGAVWRFANIGTISGTTINAEVTINSLFQAVVDNIDNNSAQDQNNVSVADFFAPRIRPDVSLNNSDRRGYVQFTINFFQGANNYTTAINIASLNFISYDADGSFESGGATSAAWLRETRVAQVYNPGNPTVLTSGSSELVAYNYTDPAVTNWNGFAGGVYERTGLSRCAQVASSFRYSTTPRSSITFRFGYDFKAGTNGYNIGTPSREYGAKFGCYTFPNQVTLPVTLLSFNGALKNNTTQLNWVAENQINFDHYEIERSNNGTSFSGVGSKAPIQNNIAARENYQHSDDLTAATGNVFFYRLKMVDADGTFKYSSIIVIRKDQKSIVGMTISPNPMVTGGMATVRFEATTRSAVEFKVVDMAGRVVLKQQNNVTEGINSIAITNLDRLQPGMYMLQMNDGSAVNVTKFTIAH